MNRSMNEFLAGRIYAITEAGIQKRPETAELNDITAFVDTYLSEGFDNLKNINGDFCGALKQQNKWILFRDHMGVRTLYYYLKGKDFAFAEDMRDLFKIDGIDLSINERLFYLRARGANLNTLTETDFQYIQCVQPGSYTDFEQNEAGWKITVHPYWIPGQKKIRYETEQEYIDKLRELVEDAVKIRLDSVEGPVGAELSGGLDSGVIDILIARSGREAKYVSWSLPYDVIPMQPVDERQVIEDICKQEGISFSFLPREDNGIDVIERHLPPFVNTIDISRTAEYFSDHGIHYVFSGHGGDEGASHRANLLELWYYHEYKEYFHEIWNARKGHHFRILGTVARVAKGVLYELPKHKSPWQNLDNDMFDCLNNDFRKKMYKETLPPLTFSFDPKQYIITGGSRNRLDNCAVQGSDYDIRYLFPLLDFRVIDFCLGIPRHMFKKAENNRYIYRKAFMNMIPQSLYDVHYKDMPSIQRSSATEENVAVEKLSVNVDKIFSDINCSYWNQYLDIESCISILSTPKAELTKGTIKRQCALLALLYTIKLFDE